MLELHGFGKHNCIAQLEAYGLSKVFNAYSKFAYYEEIFQIGFNPNSGYVYIALENGISICSCVGNDVEYLVTNMDNGEEFFFDSIEEAEKKLENMNEEEEEEEEILEEEEN